MQTLVVKFKDGSEFFDQGELIEVKVYEDFLNVQVRKPILTAEFLSSKDGPPVHSVHRFATGEIKHISVVSG